MFLIHTSLLIQAWCGVPIGTFQDVGYFWVPFKVNSLEFIYVHVLHRLKSQRKRKKIPIPMNKLSTDVVFIKVKNKWERWQCYYKIEIRPRAILQLILVTLIKNNNFFFISAHVKLFTKMEILLNGLNFRNLWQKSSIFESIKAQLMFERIVSAG